MAPLTRLVVMVERVYLVLFLALQLLTQAEELAVLQTAQAAEVAQAAGEVAELQQGGPEEILVVTELMV